MKKTLVIVVVIVVLIAAWLGGAWYTGKLIEANVSDALGRVNTAWASNPQARGLQIKQLGYERGLLSSHARYALVSSQLGNESLVEIDTTLSHGPFPLAALRRGQLLPQMFQAHSEALATAGPLQMVARMIFNGKPLLTADIGCGYGGHRCSGTGNMPPIDVDLVPIIKNAKLAFGGVQMRGDFKQQSDTDYQFNGNAQLLPLLIGGQNFGNGQIAATGDAQSFSEVISWNTDQGASKLTIAGAATRPMPLWGDPALKPEDFPQLIKTASAKLELSKPMVVDLIARGLNVAKGIDLEGARQQVGKQFDAILASDPEAAQFLQTQGDLLVSDWQYADGKLGVNGKDQPELLAQIKQGYLARMQALEQAQHAGEDAAATPPGDGDDSDGDEPPASAPAPAASGQ